VSERIKCFLLTPTKHYRRKLVRSAHREEGHRYGRHRAEQVIDSVEAHMAPSSGEIQPDEDPGPFGIGAADPRWPTTCAECGYHFGPQDRLFMSYDLLWSRSDGGPETTLHDAPPGAMWYADWMTEGLPNDPADQRWRGPDGRCLMVMVPPHHEWCVDGRCSNCTRPDDRVHKCWVRHGEPPLITVDKEGNTCAAGAGSVITSSWHGFLRNGYLEPV
jgi:hypothetical protein